MHVFEPRPRKVHPALLPAAFVEAQQKTIAPPEFRGWLPLSGDERQ